MGGCYLFAHAEPPKLSYQIPGSLTAMECDRPSWPESICRFMVLDDTTAALLPLLGVNEQGDAAGNRGRHGNIKQKGTMYEVCSDCISSAP